MLQCYVMYTMGIGTKMNREKARYWYEQISDETVKEKLQQSPRDRVGGGFRRRPLTPPDMRFRIRRFS